MSKNKRTKHSVYNLNYHIVFVTKYRHKVLSGEIETYVKERIQNICEQYQWDALALEVMPDHVHLFVSAPPKVAPLTIATTIKSILTVDVFKQFQGLKQSHFWGSGLFSRGCYYGSAGAVSSETIKKYIENQKDEE
jgi:putative transposase